ncbi:hypothetical protein CfE428DRAFT_5187 [Chthoniobacter flavus Ellin428]|uniref:Uncharacterized protein n=1 Tax=Chthoniobacter flavus Ellin428 TaxID=497964 RepID=B4D8E7_9BACT|nr:hypothetical protein CfE428DRAFT_5187 [Chthoniobacter flavus Ellin428]TCO90091.1 hypothetical protein EV701_11115 [Chthoniobacter flavus]
MELSHVRLRPLEAEALRDARGAVGAIGRWVLDVCAEGAPLCLCVTLYGPKVGHDPVFGTPVHMGVPIVTIHKIATYNAHPSPAHSVLKGG